MGICKHSPKNPEWLGTRRLHVSWHSTCQILSATGQPHRVPGQPGFILPHRLLAVRHSPHAEASKAVPAFRLRLCFRSSSAHMGERSRSNLIVGIHARLVRCNTGLPRTRHHHRSLLDPPNKIGACGGSGRRSVRTADNTE